MLASLGSLLACVFGSIEHIVLFLLWTAIVFVVSYFVTKNNPKIAAEIAGDLQLALNTAKG